MKHPHFFRLKVIQIQQTCQFELSWGDEQQVQANITYPQTILQSYQVWQRAYIQYYQHNFRARLEEKGVDNGSLNPHSYLVHSELKLLTKFKTWLGSEQLSEIRIAIAITIKQWIKQTSINQVYLFLTCSSLELERLPWEAWELETEIAAPISIYLTRTPVNIRSGHSIERNQYRHDGARILAIFGDNTGLDFQEDLKALRSLSSLAEIKIVAWHENQLISQLKREICQAISDKKGWDILFFAGHSEETKITGGELAIAPQFTISICEIEPYLKIAQAKGLQFALFNSCNGLSIANALIDLGLNQVAIMREPIHNRVAQEFLIKFLQALAQEKNVSEAMREVIHYLKESKKLDYPSAYLIPSLFCHPKAKLYKIKPFGWKKYLKQWLPNRLQTITLCFLILFSLLSPVQNWLLNQRILIQAIYRDLTSQIPQNKTPTVLLVAIDDDSFIKEKIIERVSLNRQYLAKIIEQLSRLNAQVIGIDYVLDRPQDQNDKILSQAIQNAIKQQKISFVFAAIPEGEKEIGILPEIASLNSIAQGCIQLSHYYPELPLNCRGQCPFSYLLAVIQALNTFGIVPEKSNAQGNYKTQILNSLYQVKTKEPLLNFLKQVRIHPITQISEYFQQRWLQPITDFSLPPETIYHTLPAWQLLEEKKPINREQVILIASGGYAEAGINGEKDYIDPPLAIAFWNLSASKFTGGEAHAYMIHHWLTRHLIIPIPALWLILVAAYLAKVLILQLESSSIQSKRLTLKLISINILYVLVSLQTYITFKILLPWLLPSLAFWFYILPSLRKLSDAK